MIWLKWEGGGAERFSSPFFYTDLCYFTYKTLWHKMESFLKSSPFYATFKHHTRMHTLTYIMSSLLPPQTGWPRHWIRYVLGRAKFLEQSQILGPALNRVLTQIWISSKKLELLGLYWEPNFWLWPQIFGAAPNSWSRAKVVLVL